MVKLSKALGVGLGIPEGVEVGVSVPGGVLRVPMLEPGLRCTSVRTAPTVIPMTSATRS